MAYLIIFLIPLTDRLKHPNRSPDKLSAPHYKTTASGLKLSNTD